jgi:hypothetical protein
VRCGAHSKVRPLTGAVASRRVATPRPCDLSIAPTSSRAPAWPALPPGNRDTGRRSRPATTNAFRLGFIAANPRPFLIFWYDPCDAPGLDASARDEGVMRRDGQACATRWTAGEGGPPAIVARNVGDDRDDALVHGCGPVLAQPAACPRAGAGRCGVGGGQSAWVCTLARGAASCANMQRRSVARTVHPSVRSAPASGRLNRRASQHRAVTASVDHVREADEDVTLHMSPCAAKATAVRTEFAGAPEGVSRPRQPSDDATDRWRRRRAAGSP